MTFAELIALTDRAAQTHLGGVPVVYKPEVGGLIFLIVGMFDEHYALVDPGNAGIESVGPAVTLRLEDLPIHPDEDNPTLTILGKDYTVRAREADGSIGGSIRLILRRASL